MRAGIAHNPAANTLYNYNGVTPAIRAGLAGPNFDALDITDFETEALFADFSWGITERLTLAVGAWLQRFVRSGSCGFHALRTGRPRRRRRSVWGVRFPLVVTRQG